MKKLLYITSYVNNSGGVAKLLSVKLSYLVKHYDYEIYIVNTNSETKDMFYEFDERIKISSLKQKRNRISNYITYSNRLKGAINSINPDIIINCDNGLKGSLLHHIVKSHAVLIYESHISKNLISDSFTDNLKLKLHSFFMSRNINKYKWVVAYQHAKDDWKSNNFKAISNPLLLDSPINCSLLTNKIAIAVGRLSYQKGYEVLLRIWKIVTEKHPDWILNIYGEGNVDTYIELSKVLEIENNVSFFKPVPELKNVYQNASMLLNASRFEPFGLAMIEAMAFGLPVMAFDNTLGPKSYISDNENGFLIEKGNINTYAEKIIFLIENEMEMKRISNNAKESVRKFDIKIIMDEWHELFQSI